MLHAALSDPFDALLGLQKALDRASETNFLGNGYSAKVYPSINVFQNQDGFQLRAEMPGLRKEEIKVDVKENQIRIYGERRQDFSEREVSLHRTERSFGKFDRTIQLPFKVEVERTCAEYKNGVLTLTLKEPESAKPKRIQVF